MPVKRKDIKKAIFRLKVDGKTSVETIQFLTDHMEKMFATSKPLKKESINNTIQNTKTCIVNTSPTKTEFLDLINRVSCNFPYIKAYPALLTIECFEAIVQLIEKNECLNAVKFLKEYANCGMGLRESKDIIDYIRHDQIITYNNIHPSISKLKNARLINQTLKAFPILSKYPQILNDQVFDQLVNNGTYGSLASMMRFLNDLNMKEINLITCRDIAIFIKGKVKYI